MLWTNESGTLPLQVNSRVAFAARDLEYVETTVPVPHGLDRMAASKERHRTAVAPQMRLVQDAFDSCNRLTVLFRDNDVERLRRAEREELEAAVCEVRPPDDTLPPRAASVTILVNSTKTLNATALLDAAAHLARAATTAQPPRRAVHDTRVALLVGSQARQYAAWHAPMASKTKSGTAKGSTELCTTWAERQPDSSGSGAAQVWQLRSEFVEIPWCADADAYLSTLLTLIQRLWFQNGFLPNATRLLGSYARERSAAPEEAGGGGGAAACGGGAEGAYVRGMIASADDFWNRLRVTGASRLSQYAQTSDDYCGCLEFSQQFVKLVPKTPEGVADLPPDHPSVYHGLLLHQRGMESESKEFCETIRNEELAKAVAQGRPSGVFGLRQPASSAEEVLCPHLMLVTADHTTLGRHVTSYGLLCAPGKRLCATNNDNCLPRLTCRVVPLDDEIIQQAFVLPCMQTMCDPVHDVLRKPMWHAMEEWVGEYAELFGSDQPPDSPIGKRRARECANLCAHDRCGAREPTDEERCTGILLGAPLGCAAFRIGDVYNVLRDENCVDAVAKFLLASTTTIGSEASIEEAFLKAADAVTSAESTAATHEKRIDALKRRLDESELQVEVLQRQQQQAGEQQQQRDTHKLARTGAQQQQQVATSMDAMEASPLAAPIAPALQISYQHLKMLLAGAGLRVAESGYTLRQNWKKLEIKTLCATLQSVSDDRFESTSTLEFGCNRLKQHAGKVDDLTLLCEILGHGVETMRQRALMLIVVNGVGAEHDDAIVYKVETTGVATQVQPLDLLKNASFRTFMWCDATRFIAGVRAKGEGQ